MADDPCRNLWVAVVATAVDDLSHHDPRLRYSARRFFRSSWFDDVTAGIGLSASAFRHKLGPLLSEPEVT